MFVTPWDLPEQYAGNQPVLPSGDMDIKAYGDAIQVASTGEFLINMTGLPKAEGDKDMHFLPSLRPSCT
jgi:hypothetical protein